MSKPKRKRIVDKKLYCYIVKSNNDLNMTFKKINQKINGDYSELEERGLIYTSQIDGFKYFLDVKEKNCYKKINETGKLTIYNCILYKLREDEFPYLFNLSTGNKAEIPSTAKDTLMEQTHFIIIPEINIIISEYNYIGANVVSKLLFLVDRVLGPSYSNGFKVNQVLDTETSYRVRHLKKIKKMQFKAGHQGMKTIAKHFKIGALDSMFNCFGNTEELEFEIIITGKGKNNSKNSKNIDVPDLEEFKRLCDKINITADKKTLDIKKAKVIDPTYNTALPIDLFEEYLLAEVTAIKLSDKSKYIDSEDMFKKMLGVYNNNIFEMSAYIGIELE